MTTWETGVVQTPKQFDMKGLAQCTEDPQFLKATDDISGFSAPEELQECNISDPSEQWGLYRGGMSNGEDLSATWRRKLMAVEVCSPDLIHTKLLADISITAWHCLGKDSQPHLDCSGFRELLYFSDMSTWQGSASVGWMSSPALMTQVSASHMEHSQTAVFGQNQVLWFRQKQR